MWKWSRIGKEFIHSVAYDYQALAILRSTIVHSIQHLWLCYIIMIFFSFVFNRLAQLLNQ